MRQTRAETVARAWPLLIQEYPDANALAVATPTRLLAIVEGLGFGKQRTQVLIELGAAIKPMEKLPSEPAKLMALPHVGLYTAHAVACFGFGRRVPVVDLNVIRVLSGFAGIEAPKDIRRHANYVWQIAGKLVAPKEEYLSTIMGFSILRQQSANHGHQPAFNVLLPRSANFKKCGTAG